MCGICGIAPLDHRAVPSEARLRLMVQSIRHRGPDGDGYHTAPGIGLGHARLSIIDLATGNQPIHNEDRTVWVSYNGEIFNYVELRTALRKLGHEFYTQTDTEVIVHAYEEYGDSFVDRLNGQFAIALWDAGRRRLLLIRDRAGILPLYYATSERSFVFASEIKAVLASGEVDARLDYGGLGQVFTYWSPVAPRTMFDGISQVGPGEMLVLEDGELSRRRYWDWRFPTAGELRKGDETELTHQLLARLDEATRIRLRADVPVGAYLSGGLDSSSIVALLQRSGVDALKTYSIGFENASLDESAHQRSMADWLHTEHSFIRCTEPEIAHDFMDTIWHTETPVLRTAPAPMRMLSALVRRSGLKVVLTGEGADEVLGGYDLFKEAKIRRFWASNPESNWRPRLLKRLYPYLDLGTGRSQEYLKEFFGTGLREPDLPQFSHLPRWTLTMQIGRFCSPQVRAAFGTDYQDIVSSLPEEFSTWHPFNRAEYLEAKTLLPGYILSSQGDRMLMANSVEGRFPFLDHHLIEFSNGLHPKYKMRALNEKALLKRAMRGKLPQSILARYKQPYRGPGAAIFRSERAMDLTSTLLSPTRLRDAGCFEPTSVSYLRRKVERGGPLGERDNMAYIGILSTQAWQYWFVEGRWKDRAIGTTVAAAGTDGA